MSSKEQVTYKITNLRTVEGQDVVEGLAYFKGNYYIWNTDMENSDEPKVQQLYEYDLKNIHKLQLEQHQFLKSKIEEYVLEQRIRLLLEETDTKEAIRKLVNYISDLYKEQVLDECEVAFLADENYITVQIEGVFEQEVVAALGVRNNLFSSYDRNKHMLFLNLEDILAIGDQLISLILNSITLWQDWKSKRVEKQENLIPKLQKEGVDNEERVRLEEISSNERIRVKQLESEERVRLEEISSNERIRVKQLESGERVRLKEISSNERIKMKQLESEESNREQEDRIKSVVVVLKEENLPAAARAGIASMEIER